MINAGPLRTIQSYTRCYTIGVTMFVKMGGTHQDGVKEVDINLIIYIYIYIYRH